MSAFSSVRILVTLLVLTGRCLACQEWGMDHWACARVEKAMEISLRTILSVFDTDHPRWSPPPLSPYEQEQARRAALVNLAGIDAWVNGTLDAYPSQVYGWFMSRPTETNVTLEIKAIIDSKRAAIERKAEAYRRMDWPSASDLARCLRCVVWVSPYEEPSLPCHHCDNYTIPNSKAGQVAAVEFRFNPHRSPAEILQLPTLKNKWVHSPWPMAYLAATLETIPRLCIVIGFLSLAIAGVVRTVSDLR